MLSLPIFQAFQAFPIFRKSEENFVILICNFPIKLIESQRVAVTLTSETRSKLRVCRSGEIDVASAKVSRFR